MSPSTLTSNNKGKGKKKATNIPDDGSESAYDSDSDSDSSSESALDSEKLEIETRVPQNKPGIPPATVNVQSPPGGNEEEEEIIFTSSSRPPIPKLNPGHLPVPYITRFKGSGKQSSLASRLISIRDPELEKLEKVTAFLDGPAPPIPPPELTKSGKPLTKKQMKELKHKTAGPDWFDLPAPSEADLPRMYREVEALRLRNQLDPKRFYKKDDGEGMGIKGLPKYFAIGTILPTPTPFATPSADNLTRAKRKKTLVDELVDDAEAKRYAKKKFNELQADRGAKGRKTLRAKQAMRMPKW